MLEMVSFQGCFSLEFEFRLVLELSLSHISLLILQLSLGDVQVVFGVSQLLLGVGKSSLLI
jgi:hypothetical protein